MDNKMKIELSKDEIETAAMVGIKRQLSSTEKGRQEHSGMANNFQSHIIGAIGEYAFCKQFERHFDITTNHVNKNDVPDSNRPIDIKTTTKPNAPNALINQSTSPDRYANFIFIFCAYDAGTVIFWGWIESENYFKKAILKQMVPGRQKCWCLDKKELNQITPEMVERHKKNRS